MLISFSQPPTHCCDPALCSLVLYLLLFSHSVMSDFLWPHGLQHTRLPCPSLFPRVCSNLCLLIWWCHPTISSSITPFSSCLQSFAASGSFPMSWLCIRWPNYWNFSFGISPSNEYSGLISFRVDWFDFLAVQVTLKSLLQHHSSKASILGHSAFFMMQFSHPHMTTGKIIALTRWTFVINYFPPAPLHSIIWPLTNPWAAIRISLYTLLVFFGRLYTQISPYSHTLYLLLPSWVIYQATKLIRRRRQVHVQVLISFKTSKWRKFLPSISRNFEASVCLRSLLCWLYTMGSYQWCRLLPIWHVHGEREAVIPSYTLSLHSIVYGWMMLIFQLKSMCETLLLKFILSEFCFHFNVEGHNKMLLSYPRGQIKCEWKHFSKSKLW